MTTKIIHAYTPVEEMLHATSHGLAAAAAIVALTLMLVKGLPVLNGWQLAGIAVYGGSMIALFLGSTLYHGIHHGPSKDVLKRVDHSAIYLLIAGTYTPFMTITLQSTAATVLLAVVWALAIAGVFFKVFFVHRYKRLSLATYLVMGWLAVFLIYELWLVLPRPGFWLLLAGGLCYTLGAPFYALKQYRYTHLVWHLWVVAGAACHAVAVAVYVIPSKPL